MHQYYYEVRNLAAKPSLSFSGDIAKHLQTRQYLGTVVVVCDNPHSMQSATRKLWLKGARYLQKLRASTLNAEEILRLTHGIMHMQNMQFVAKQPQDNPDATVYFVTPNQLKHMPYNCFTVYITMCLAKTTLTDMLAKLPTDALIVDYATDLPLGELGLQPRTLLEEQVLTKWSHMVAFLQRHNITPTNLVVGSALQLSAMDNALDILLDTSTGFLREAADLQRSINLAQPLTTIPSDQQKLFEAVTRLAHRVQALSPGAFSGYLINTFGDSEANHYFLRDIAAEMWEHILANQWS